MVDTSSAGWNGGEDHAHDVAAHPHHSGGKVMRLTLNPAFVNAVGEEGVAGYAQAIVEVAARPGLTVTETIDALTQGWGARGIELNAITTERVAEQLADPDRVGVIIDYEDGRRVVGDDIEVADTEAAYQERADRTEPGQTEEKASREPEDPRRPLYT